jgi:hypothetical protein
LEPSAWDSRSVLQSERLRADHPGMRANERVDNAFWWAVVSAALIVVGSLGPWGKGLNGLVTVSGVDGDGKITLICGLLAAGVLVFEARGTVDRTLLALLVPLALIAATVGVVDIAKVLGTQTSGSPLFKGDIVSPGWGIWLVILASASLVAASIAGVVRRQPRLKARVTGR